MVENFKELWRWKINKIFGKLICIYEVLDVHYQYAKFKSQKMVWFHVDGGCLHWLIHYKCSLDYYKYLRYKLYRSLDNPLQYKRRDKYCNESRCFQILLIKKHIPEKEEEDRRPLIVPCSPEWEYCLISRSRMLLLFQSREILIPLK